MNGHGVPSFLGFWWAVGCLALLSAMPAGALVVADREEPEAAAVAFRVAQDHAAAGRVEPALAAARRAVALAPEEVEYLRGLARLAAWQGEYPEAHTSWERVLALLGEDQEASLGRARTAAWAGETDPAVQLYRDHVAAYPGDEAAWIELARVVTWQGNAASALEVLEAYRERFGATEDYREEKAKVLLDGARPTEALSLIEPLAETGPESHRRQRLLALALAQDGQIRKAREQLATVRNLGPDDPSTRQTELLVETPLRSTVTPSQNFFSDSDSVEQWLSAITGELAVAAGSRLSMGLSRGELRADAQSGLDSLDGRDVRTEEGWLGLRQRLSTRWLLEGRLGGAEVDDGNDLLTYRFRLEGRPTDVLTLGLERQRSFYAVSPRALDLGIHRTANQLSLQWRPGLRGTVEVLGSLDDYSDGNRRWEAVLAPRRQALRRQSFNLDLGLRGWWFAFDDSPGNGYYAPGSYQRYAATAFGYWKVSDQIGVSFVSSVGWFKDDTMDSFELGGDLTVEATFGIFGDWMLLVRVGVTENQRQETGAFNAHGGRLALTRRF